MSSALPPQRQVIRDTLPLSIKTSLPSVEISPDFRVLVVFSLFNSVYGHDEEYGTEMSPVRKVVRDHRHSRLRQVGQSGIERWREFYDAHPLHLWAYLYFALSVQTSEWEVFRFDAADPPRDLSGVVAQHSGFRRVTAEAAELLELTPLYGRILPSWLDAVGSYDDRPIIRDIARIHRFVRLGPTDPVHSAIRFIPAPFDSHFIAYAAPFRGVFYTIDGPARLSNHRIQHA